ncbi:MAG: hypothetical protein C0594_02435 [Marinilabiliales bacterium]|nr:MAG: hypothetical protein C0594_02435 [Marinilabiliales bacterium]
MIRLFIIFTSLLFVWNCFAENKTKTDSLLNVISNSNDDTTKVKALLKLGYQFEYSNPDTSLYYYIKAQQLAIKAGNKKLEANSLNCIGIVYKHKSDYPKALAAYNKALIVNEEYGDKKAMASNLGNIGVIHMSQSRYDTALDYFFRALRILEEINNKDIIAFNLGNIGIIYYYQKQYDKALEYYNKTLQAFKEIGYQDGVAANLGNIGIVYYDQKQYDKALDYYRQALKINTEIGYKDRMASNLSNIGLVYSIKKQYKKALEYYEKAKQINTEVSSKGGLVANLKNIANLYVNMKQFDKAYEYAQKSLSLAKEIGDLHQEREAYESLSLSCEGLHDFENALKFNKKWIELNDSIFNIEKAKSIDNMMALYETEKKEQQIKLQKVELEKSYEQTAREKAEKERQQAQRNFLIIAFGLVLILAFFIFRGYNQKKRANALLTEQKKQISEQNFKLSQANEEITTQRDLVTQQKEFIENQKNEIEDSILYAKRIQTALLPNKNTADSILGEHFIIFKPKDVVSGDFYWATKVNDWLIVTAADCTGHGVPGAFMSMLGVSFLNEIVRKKEITSAAMVLDNLRSYIIEALKQTGEQGSSKDGMDMSLAAINNNFCLWAGANNPLWIIRADQHEKTNSTEKQIEEYKPDKMPVAYYPRMTPFSNNEINLNKGDRLYLFTDGFPDQFGGPMGKKFMHKSFKNQLAETSALSMTDQCAQLEKTLQHWMIGHEREYEQIDDITVVGIEI